MLGRRLILLVSLLAMFVFVATVEEQAGAADPQLVEGEDFEGQPTGTKVVTDTALYAPPDGQALKFTNDTATATQRVNFGSQGNIVLVARGGRSGGASNLSVNVDGGAFSAAQDISNNGDPVAYTYALNVPAGNHTIGVRAGNTGTGRYPFLDYATFPAAGGGGTPTDTDGDGVPDSTDQCDTQPGPASNNGCPVTTPPDWNCTGTDIRPGQDIDAIINDRPRGATRFCVHEGEYQVSEVARLKDGDTLEGEPNWPTDSVGPATKPTPVVFLKGSGPDTLLSALGSDISITWVDVRGASGTGRGTGAIAAGSADSEFLVRYSRIHNNDSLGISNAKGRILDSEFFSNSEAGGSIGVNGSAIKGITQFEAGNLYVHEEQGNGIWCDVGCDEDSAREHGFWVHHSVVVESGRAGIRYENSSTEALIENNEIHANGLKERRGGVDIRDSQHALVQENHFGRATIAGVDYDPNGGNIGVRATDSGRSDRVNLSDIDVVGNDMNGDRIVSCDSQVVACSNNSP